METKGKIDEKLLKNTNAMIELFTKEIGGDCELYNPDHFDGPDAILIYNMTGKFKLLRMNNVLLVQEFITKDQHNINFDAINNFINKDIYDCEGEILKLFRANDMNTVTDDYNKMLEVLYIGNIIRLQDFKFYLKPLKVKKPFDYINNMIEEFNTAYANGKITDTKIAYGYTADAKVFTYKPFDDEFILSLKENADSLKSFKALVYDLQTINSLSLANKIIDLDMDTIIGIMIDSIPDAVLDGSLSVSTTKVVIDDALPEKFSFNEWLQKTKV